MSDSILNKLLGGDLRSIGNAEEVISEILNDPSLFDVVFYGMKDQNPLIRMRSADVAEKVSRLHPNYLIPHKEELIYKISEIEQQEVRWHVASMFTYLRLSDEEKSEVVRKLINWIENSKSKIVIANSLEALTHIANEDEKYMAEAIKILEKSVETGSPAVAARARKLMKLITKN